MVDIPWPNIKTQIESGQRQRVPLKEDYAFEDMWYLDTPQASPIFKFQADIITKEQSKGIIDIGCRHGPVLEYLDHQFNYMGFDTSVEPIEMATKQWKDYPNIEFRCESWNEKETFIVDFNVDMVIFSGVLLYRSDHFDFFEWIMNYYGAKRAIIQEPYHQQDYWDDSLILNTITEELAEYKNKYGCKETLIECKIFAGKRLIVDVEM